MTSDGSAYTRFRSAVKSGNLDLVRAAAAELPRIGLDDALAICLLLRTGDGFERAAVRWMGRFCLEGQRVDLEAVQQAASAFAAMPEQPGPAQEILARLCRRHRLVV